MKHIKKYHVNYHDTDQNFRLKIFYAVRYMQETALAGFDRLDAPRRELVEKGLAFVLSKISLRFEGDIKKYDDITVETWAMPFRPLMFVRNYKITNETTGACAVRAASSWALLNILDKTLVRPDTLSANYTAVTDTEELGFDPVRRIKMPDDESLGLDKAFLFERRVLYNDIDENSHMNNTVYLDIAENALHEAAKGGLPGKLLALDLSYNNAASEGDCISVRGIKIDTETGAEIFIRGQIGETNCFDARALYS